MANIKFRESASAANPGATTTKGSPLTNLELDGNLKSINDDLIAVTSSNALKAPITDPTFSGTVTGGAGGFVGNASTSNNVTGGAGGQILYQSSVNVTAKLANGALGQYLTSGGTTLAPSWTTLPVSNNGTLGSTAAAAGSTNTTVSISFSGAYSANTATNVTINPVVGPALTALATTMTGVGTGYLRKTGADTYSVDTSVINDASLTRSIPLAGATGTAIDLSFPSGFSANASSNSTISTLVGPALTSLAATMTGAGSGYLRKNGSDTYSVDSSAFVNYNITSSVPGQFDSGVITPIGINRLNYSGHFYPTYINLMASDDTITQASHYLVEVGTDGFVRPKPLANVQTEVVTGASVNAATAGVAVTAASFNSVTGLSAFTPIINGTAAIGVATAAARADHVHQITNSSDGVLLSRFNHTGTQSASTISDFASTVRTTILSGLSFASSAIVSATNTILEAIGLLQTQVSNNLASLNSHTGNTSNPHSTTKAQVGLSEVDNTSDVNKSVSNATASHVITERSNTATLSNKTLNNPSNTSQTLADAATITWDMNGGAIATVTIGGNRAVANPVNLRVGSVVLIVNQDGVGNKYLSWGTAFKHNAATPPVLSTAANAKDILTGFCDGTNIHIGMMSRGSA